MPIFPVLMAYSQAVSTDDYQLRAPIKQVTEFQDFLGQEGWRVRATVFRFGDEDADLDIVITRRAWSGDQPPHVGQDIEGTLWLQGICGIRISEAMMNEQTVSIPCHLVARMIERSLEFIFNAALAVADPYQAVLNAVRVGNKALQISGATYDLADSSRILVIGAGKASASKAQVTIRATHRVPASRLNRFPLLWVNLTLPPPRKP